MSFWQEHDIEDKVVPFLGNVSEYAEGHHLGRPTIGRTTRGTP